MLTLQLDGAEELFVRQQHAASVVCVDQCWCAGRRRNGGCCPSRCGCRRGLGCAASASAGLPRQACWWGGGHGRRTGGAKPSLSADGRGGPIWKAGGQAGGEGSTLEVPCGLARHSFWQGLSRRRAGAGQKSGQLPHGCCGVSPLGSAAPPMPYPDDTCGHLRAPAAPQRRPPVGITHESRRCSSWLDPPAAPAAARPPRRAAAATPRHPTVAWPHPFAHTRPSLQAGGKRLRGGSSHRSSIWQRRHARLGQ